MSYTCLLTGVKGFVGSHLAARLHLAGWRVTAITRDGTSAEVLPCVEVLGSSANLDSVSNAIKLAKPDVVFHLAAAVRVDHSPHDVDVMLHDNLQFTLHLLEAMRIHACGKLVNASSGWQNWGGRKYRPVCLYAAMKQAAEDLIDYYASAHDLKAISLVLHDNFGPHDPRKKLFYWLKLAATAEQPVPFSQGEQLLDLLYIDDVCAGFISAAMRVLSAHAPRHERFRLGNRKFYKLREVAQMFEAESGSKLNIDWGARPYRAREVMAPSRSAPILPDWKQEFSVRRGITEILRESTGGIRFAVLDQKRGA